MKEIVKEIDKAAYVTASLLIHNGGSLESRVNELHAQYPFIDLEVVYLGVQYHWTKIMRRNVCA